MLPDTDITIDDFHPRNDGFVQSYKGQWREQGMCATAWLDTVEPGHFPPGLFLRNAYELSLTYERVLGGRPREARQEERGAQLAQKLRERMKTEMKAAGWQVVAHTKEGREIWQYTPPVSKQPEVTTRQITITRKARPVSFTCTVCGKETTQVRFPGPKPRYCDTCRKPHEREKTQERVTKFRKRQRSDNQQPR